MSITTVLFDLDGTLLPMDQEKFIKAYFGGMAKKLMPYGFDKDELIKAIWAGTKAMVLNDGSVKNEARFWEVFNGIYGEKARLAESLLDEFYAEDFPKVSASCGYNPKSAQSIAAIKSKGYRTVLATNPIFPAVATHCRIVWTGLKPEDFEFVTTYENSCYCKPNPDYYREILDKIGCKAEECLMVGNDVGEDMIAKTLGMKVFLLTDDLINQNNADISIYPHGSFDELMSYIEENC